MVYRVITWDDTLHCTRYHEIVDAIDEIDAEECVKHLYPNEKVLGVTFPLANENQ